MNQTRTETEEFVTIIAHSTEEAMRQFQAQGLGQRGFAIAGRIGRHRFSLAAAEGVSELFQGQSLVAATFTRRVPA